MKRTRTRINFGRATLSVVAASLYAGCASAPKFNYFTLDMQRASSAEPAINIEVGRVRASDAVARDGIMILKTPTQIEYYAVDRWVSNPGELIREKLAAEFGESAPDRRTVTVSADVLRFGQIDTETGADAEIKMLIAAAYSSGPRTTVSLLNKTYESRVPAAGARAADVVEALSRSLETLASEIAADVNEAYAQQAP